MAEVSQQAQRRPAAEQTRAPERSVPGPADAQFAPADRFRHDVQRENSNTYFAETTSAPPAATTSPEVNTRHDLSWVRDDFTKSILENIRDKHPEQMDKVLEFYRRRSGYIGSQHEAQGDNLIDRQIKLEALIEKHKKQIERLEEQLTESKEDRFGTRQSYGNRRNGNKSHKIASPTQVEITYLSRITSRLEGELNEVEYQIKIGGESYKEKAAEAQNSYTRRLLEQGVIDRELMPYVSPELVRADPARAAYMHPADRKAFMAERRAELEAAQASRQLESRQAALDKAAQNLNVLSRSESTSAQAEYASLLRRVPAEVRAAHERQTGLDRPPPEDRGYNMPLDEARQIEKQKLQRFLDPQMKAAYERTTGQKIDDRATQASSAPQFRTRGSQPQTIRVESAIPVPAPERSVSGLALHDPGHAALIQRSEREIPLVVARADSLLASPALSQAERIALQRWKSDVVQIRVLAESSLTIDKQARETANTDEQRSLAQTGAPLRKRWEELSDMTSGKPHLLPARANHEDAYKLLLPNIKTTSSTPSQPHVDRQIRSLTDYYSKTAQILAADPGSQEGAARMQVIRSSITQASEPLRRSMTAQMERELPGKTGLERFVSEQVLLLLKESTSAPGGTQPGPNRETPPAPPAGPTIDQFNLFSRRVTDIYEENMKDPQGARERADRLKKEILALPIPVRQSLATHLRTNHSSEDILLNRSLRKLDELLDPETSIAV